jgi:hypothetical protein
LVETYMWRLIFVVPDDRRSTEDRRR